MEFVIGFGGGVLIASFIILLNDVNNRDRVVVITFWCGASIILSALVLTLISLPTAGSVMIEATVTPTVNAVLGR